MQQGHKCFFGIAGIMTLLAVMSGNVRADIIVPNAQAFSEGNEASEFLTEDPRSTSVRYQQVFAASQFNGPGIITEIAFRPDSLRGAPFTITISNLLISLSTTSKAPDGLSATFADNIGSDETVVFNGDLTLSSADVAGPGGAEHLTS